MNPMSTSKWFQSTWAYFITTKLEGKNNQMVWNSLVGNFPTPKMFCSPKPNPNNKEISQKIFLNCENKLNWKKNL
jgi:hypothetical protein